MHTTLKGKMRAYLLYFMIAFSTTLYAQESISNSISYIKLDKGQYTHQEIIEKSRQNLFKPLKKTKSNFGFDNSIFWIKFESQNSSSQQISQILEFSYPSLDTIDIYELIDGSLELKKELGDRRNYDQSTIMPNPSYLFAVPPKQERVFLARVQSEGVLNIGTTLYSINQYIKHSTIQSKFISFYFGAIFIMLIYNLVLFVISKNLSFLYYVLFHVSFLLFATNQLGISFEIFWPNMPDINGFIQPVVLAVTCAFAILFAIYFMNIKDANQRMYKYLHYLTILSFLVALMPLFASYNISIRAGSLLSVIVTTSLIFLGINLAVSKKSINAIFYLIAWSFFFLGVIINQLAFIGVLPSTTLTNFPTQIGSFMEVLILSMGLAYYYSRLQKDHAKLTFANNRLLTLSQTDMLTGAFNRRFFYDSVKRSLENRAEDDSNCYIMMLDLDHFKNINDTYGHSTGDKVLVSFTNKVKNILRENDIFARYGGEEFVLFLPNTDKNTVVEIAKRINATIKNTTFKCAPGLKITVSIGIGHNVCELNELLQRADTALYQAKESGRDTYGIVGE